jgi:membrane protein
MMVRTNGPFVIFSVLAVLWAAEQVGFGFTTTFEALFEVRSRSFIGERLVHFSMFLVFVALMLIIVAATTVRAAVEHSITHSQLPDVLQTPVTTIVSLSAAFLLFAAIYMMYPNTHERLKLAHVWRGAALAAILFQILTYIWPLYVSNFSRYGGILFPILVLVVWIYFFSFILVIGAEVVAVSSIREANKRGEEVGPTTDGTFPQHRTLREE